MTWWVLTQSQPVATYNSLTIRAYTNTADHLFVSWAYHKPARHPIYRIVRGTSVFCGYNYIWDTPFLTEQSQPGDTTYHTFLLTNLTPASTIWYYLWAPDGPYGNQIQGPLQHYVLPLPPWWARKAYIATQLKGIYYTRTLKGPSEPQPTWIRLNQGLHSLKVWQLCTDQLAPDKRMFAIVGEPASRIVYRMTLPDLPWWFPLLPIFWPDWQPLLTTEDCCTLTGAASGEICWIACNPVLPGRFYVLFNTPIGDKGVWCIRTEDYGLTWQPFRIYPGVLNNTAGNISVGHLVGTSPYAPGSVLYAALNIGLFWVPSIYLSSDQGETWTYRDGGFLQLFTPRCHVDPTDQSIVYTGFMRNLANPQELWRSTEHGANLTEVDGDLHLGINISPLWGNMWVHDTDQAWATIISGHHIFTTLDYCLTWTDWGPCRNYVERLHIISHSPGYLYLARNQNAWPPVTPHGPHVFYISDNNGVDMTGRAGDHPHLEEGAGDSIPLDCGGVSLDGILFPEPDQYEFWE